MQRSNLASGSAVLRRVGALVLLALAACSGDKVTGNDDSEAAKAKTGSLLVTATGLPNGISAQLTVTRANTSRTVTSGVALTGLETGSYTLNAAAVSADGITYDPTPASQSLNITNNKQTTTSVVYKRRGGTLVVNVAGLPAGAQSAIILTPPIGANIAVTGTTTLNGAAPGAWKLNASPVTAGGFTYTPSSGVLEATLLANTTSTFDVNYSVSTGAIALAIFGLPQGVNGAVNVTGPNGYQRLVQSTTTITDLVPGTYTVAAVDVQSGGQPWRGLPASQQVTVTASTIAKPAQVTYSALTSTLVVGIIDAPQGASNMVVVSGPSGFATTISSTSQFEMVSPGVYTVTANPVTTALGTFTATPAVSQTTLDAAERDSIGVTYKLSTGSIALAITGLPAGMNGDVVVTGPGGFSQSVTSTRTLLNLVPGAYTLTAAGVVGGGMQYTPVPVTQEVIVTASSVAAAASVNYTGVAVAGSMLVSINGLPIGVNAAVNVSGPGTNTVVTASQTLHSLATGTYVVTAGNVVSEGKTYSPTPASQNVQVTNGNTSNVAVTYTEVAPSLDDLSVEFAYVTQATQRPDGSVTLVAGRDALLRVFVINSRANSLTPAVRARIYDGATLIQTSTISAPEASVRLATAEGTMSSTWNLPIAGANVRTNMRILVDVDPTDSVVESSESNNVWPRNSVPQSVSVVDVPPFNVRFVPVTVQGVTGNVTESNKGEYLRVLRRMFPVNDINASVRLPFNSTASTLQSNGSNWLTVLSEMLSLQQAEGPFTTHYYGVVKVGYGSGVAGYGYVPGRAAMGWDHLPSGDGVAAHEFGHNFSRPHSPCGGVANPDPNYPYSGGVTGAFGWNVDGGSLVQPTATDIMGYCNNQWISDYTWSKVLTYRQSSGYLAAASAQGVKSNGGLLVSGTIVNGRIALNPAYRVDAPPTAASSGTTHRIEALDKRGNVMLEIPVVAQRVDHAASGDERAFAAVIPWTDRMERALARIRVRDARTPLVSATISSEAAESATVDDNVAAAIPDPAAVVERPRADRARIRWNRPEFKGAMVKDAATGQIIAFVRNSGTEIVARDGRPIDIVYSDGVRSVVKRNQR